MIGVILAGGQGTRLRLKDSDPPKPLTAIGGVTLLDRSIDYLATSGVNDIMILGGFRASLLVEHLSRRSAPSLDGALCRFSAGLPRGVDCLTVHLGAASENTGARLARLPALQPSDRYLVQYVDVVTDASLTSMLEAHDRHGLPMTMLAVRPRPRYGELDIIGNHVTGMREKPRSTRRWINGGVFVLDRRALVELDAASNEDFSQGPIQRLATRGEVTAYKHRGRWVSVESIQDINSALEIVAGFG